MTWAEKLYISFQQKKKDFQTKELEQTIFIFKINQNLSFGKKLIERSEKMYSSSQNFINSKLGIESLIKYVLTQFL